MVRVVGLGLIQNEHGVWCVRRKVPKRLEEAVARVQGATKSRQPWLKRSLRTKDEARAKVLAKPVGMEFDRIIADAEALVAERLLRTRLPGIFMAPTGSHWVSRVAEALWHLDAQSWAALKIGRNFSV